MKITVVYGGRGLIDDPTLYVLEKIQNVLAELRVTVERINLYEQKNQISTLPASLKDTDGVILGVSLEWFGIGGYMQEFLDACWLYGDKEKLQSLYMMPVVTATTTGEKMAKMMLEEAWEILGGTTAQGICAYVENHVDFEMHKEYAKCIEQLAEDLYRVINQHRVMLPSSIGVIKNTVLKAQGLELTPQESEQLSKIVSDDSYVKQQKEDIEELASMFKGMLEEEEQEEEVAETVSSSEQTNIAKEENQQSTKELLSSLRNIAQSITEAREDTVFPQDFREILSQHFVPDKSFQAVYILHLQDQKKILCLQVNGEQLEMQYVNKEEGDVILQLNSHVLKDIVSGKMTFQKAFMGGDMTVKGNFKTLRMLDQIFVFA